MNIRTTTIAFLLMSFTLLAQTDLEVLEQSPRHHEWVELKMKARRFIILWFILKCLKKQKYLS
jgi:hypothetical protein